MISITMSMPLIIIHLLRTIIMTMHITHEMGHVHHRDHHHDPRHALRRVLPHVHHHLHVIITKTILFIARHHRQLAPVLLADGQAL
jgi:hypothetical protein